MELTWKRILCQPGGVEWMLPWMPLLLLMIAGPADATVAVLQVIAIPATAVALHRDARRRPRRSPRSLVAEAAIWTVAFALSAWLLPSGPLDLALFAFAMALWVWVSRAGRDEIEAAC